MNDATKELIAWALFWLMVSSLIPRPNHAFRLSEKQIIEALKKYKGKQNDQK